MAQPKNDNDKPVTIQTDRFTRDDMKKLAKIEARKLRLRHMYINEWLHLLVDREKGKAIESGDWK